MYHFTPLAQRTVGRVSCVILTLWYSVCELVEVSASCASMIQPVVCAPSSNSMGKKHDVEFFSKTNGRAKYKS